MRIMLIFATATLAGLFGLTVRAEQPAAAPSQPSSSAPPASASAQPTPAPGALNQQDQDVCSYAMDLEPPTATERCQPGAWDALKAGEPGKIKERGVLVKKIYSALQEQAPTSGTIQDDSHRTDSTKLRSGVMEAARKQNPYFSDETVGFEVNSLTPDDVSERTFPAWIRGEDPQKLAQAYRMWLLLKNEQLRVEKYTQRYETPEQKQLAQERRNAIDAQLVQNKMVLERLKNPNEFARTVDNARHISGSVDVAAQDAVSASWRAEQESKPATLAMKLRHPIDNSVPALAAMEQKGRAPETGLWGTAQGLAGAAGLGLLGAGGLLLASSRKEAEDKAQAETRVRAEVAAEDAAAPPPPASGDAGAVTQQQAQSDVASGGRTWVNGAVQLAGSVVVLAGAGAFLAGSVPAAAVIGVAGVGIILYGQFKKY